MKTKYAALIFSVAAAIPGLGGVCLAGGANSVRMGELLPASEIYLGFHALCLDEHRSTGPVTVGGRVFKEGIGVEINSSLIYALRGAYKKLDIKAGVSSEGKEFYSDKKVVFEVHGDGKLLYLGKEKKWNDAPDNISVSLEGIKLLRLKYGAFFV